MTLPVPDEKAFCICQKQNKVFIKTNASFFIRDKCSCHITLCSHLIGVKFFVFQLEKLEQVLRVHPERGEPVCLLRREVWLQQDRSWDGSLHQRQPPQNSRPDAERENLDQTNLAPIQQNFFTLYWNWFAENGYGTWRNQSECLNANIE